MPLSRLYRLGATPQRVSKAYLLAGPDRAVASLRQHLNESEVIDGFRILAPGTTRREIAVDSGWRWMHDPDSRRVVHDGLVKGSVKIANLARDADCTLMPAATRLDQSATWRDWVAGDGHEVEVSSPTEREVVNNLLRAWSPVLIALTGRPGIDSGIEPLASRRLVDSAKHLTTRYLASGSPRHLEAVTAELRRTTGIRSLSAMDIHPADGGDARLSVAIRCIDAQAFVGSTIAHAILVQALAMHARRLVRDGRRQGNLPQRLLEQQRQEAAVGGLDARVALDSGPGVASKRGDRNKPEPRPKAELGVLALELFEVLQPEFGTLEVGYREVLPVLGWTLVAGRSPRTETELLAHRGIETATRMAQLVAAPENHEPDFLLEPNQLQTLRDSGARWERICAKRPSTRGDAAAGENPRKASPRVRQQGGPRRQSGRPEHGAEQSRSAQRDRLERLERIDGHDESIETLVEEVRALPLTEELVPWQGPARADEIKRLRSTLRPPGKRRLKAGAQTFTPDAKSVRGAIDLAEREGSALITVTVEPDHVETVRAVLPDVLGQSSAVVGALLAIQKFRDRKTGESRVSFDILFLRVGKEAP